MQPEMLIVAGANGSGKSTFAFDFIREFGWTYLGADAIAAEIAGVAASAEVQLRAGRQFFENFQVLLARRESFVVETTLSGLGFRRMIREAKSAGFKVTIYFFYLDSADVCVARVAERVRKGGHHVPEADVRRRFHRSCTNFWSIYRAMTDHWVVMYNGAQVVHEVVFGEREVFVIGDTARFESFLQLAERESI